MNPVRPPLLSEAWVTVLLLWPVVMLNYLDRMIFTTMKSSIMADIPDIGTEVAWGSLMSAFLYGYGAMSLVGGYLSDRFSRRWVIILSLGLWSLVTWLTGRAQTYDQLWWARLAMGVSEACYIPAGLAMIADYHSSRTRARAVATHQSGMKTGQILGGFGGYVADSSYGWRFGFEWLGAFGVLYAAFLCWHLRNPPASSGAASGPPASSWLGSLREVLGIGAFILLLAYVTLPALPNWVIKSWMPAVLADLFKLSQGHAGSSATLSVVLGTFAGLALGGWLSDRWQEKSARGRIYVSSIGLTLCIPALVGVGVSPNLAAAIAFLVLFGVGWGFFDTNTMPILCMIVRPQLRATAFGLLNVVTVFVGGWAVDRMGAMRDAGQPQSLMFNLCALGAAMSVLLILFIKPKPSSS